MLDAKNIVFGYNKNTTVLNDLSFNVTKGATVAFVGASGCGKSTLLRIISGILPNTNDNQLNGQVRINGQIPDEYRKAGRLAFMFQEDTLMPNLSVKENIALPLKIKGINDDKKINTLVQTVGLTEYTNYLPKQLSGGMKTRVALARSFVTGPELLLLDEPFSALDIAWKSKLYIELEKLREQYHTTIIFVTHDVQEALLLSNNVLVFNDIGEIQKCYTLETSKSISQRVNDISGFMKEVYTGYMLPIQDAIMKGKKPEK